MQQIACGRLGCILNIDSIGVDCGAKDWALGGQKRKVVGKRTDSQS